MGGSRGELSFNTPSSKEQDNTRNICPLSTKKNRNFIDHSSYLSIKNRCTDAIKSSSTADKVIDNIVKVCATHKIKLKEDSTDDETKNRAEESIVADQFISKNNTETRLSPTNNDVATNNTNAGGNTSIESNSEEDHISKRKKAAALIESLKSGDIFNSTNATAAGGQGSTGEDNADISHLHQAARVARRIVHRRQHSDTSNSSISSSVKRQHSRDWLFMSILTLGVGIFDKGFDMLFLIELNQEHEWVFLSISALVLIISTLLSSVLAAQSFWFQSSQLPSWGPSSVWVEQVTTKKKWHLLSIFTKPINSRVVPKNSSSPEQNEGEHIENHEHCTSVCVNETNPNTLTQQSVYTISKAKNSINNNDANNYSIEDKSRIPSAGQTFTKHNSSTEISKEHNNLKTQHFEISSNNQNDKSDRNLNNIEVGNKARSSVCKCTNCMIETNSARSSARSSTSSSSLQDRTDCGSCNEKIETTQQFCPWVRYLLLAIGFTGFLPEFVLGVNLVMYFKSGSSRRAVSCLLRDTWFVQTLKLVEALLESIPQLHIKMFYFLTRDGELLDVLVNHESWYLSHGIGLFVSGGSICFGLVAIMHLNMIYKILTFVLLYINLITRTAACAALELVTTHGIYFVPFACALTVSASVTGVLTLAKKDTDDRHRRKLEKYIAYPVMRTFCLPPIDATGSVLSMVFVAAALAACLLYTSDQDVIVLVIQSLLVVFVVLGQAVPGILWCITGISQHNKKNQYAR